MNYRVTAVDGSIIVPAEHAREAYDITPEHLRHPHQDGRDGAFMLLDEDDLGRRIPTVYQPITDQP
jgi:hypothetical protein